MARQARLDVPLSTEQRAELDALASATGLTPTAAGRLAITQFFSKRELLVSGASAGPDGDLDCFLAEVGADPRLAGMVPALADAFRALDLEADGNPDAAALFAVVVTICRARGSLVDRLRVPLELASFKGVVSIPRSLLYPNHTQRKG
jgi:hypothetical protein